MKEYDQLKSWREQNIKTVSGDSIKLNEFHDRLIIATVHVAIEKVKSEWGPAPARFSFFIMGSAGRSEQSVWSDQDHGIIYQGPEEVNPYFLKLGEEISNALFAVGYDFCDGNVMASNPRWCKSTAAWADQLHDWFDNESWESLRHFSTFFDSRVLVGNEEYLAELKRIAFWRLEQNKNLYLRLIENVSHIRKGVGLFGQLLPNSYGDEAGTINLKEKVFFPYVNSLRLLALWEKLTEPSTLVRFKRLESTYGYLENYKNLFIILLNYRLRFQHDTKSYEKVHLLEVERLTRKEKQELKQMMKNGYKLFSDTRGIIEKGVRLENK